jgi:hypothetical protein
MGADGLGPAGEPDNAPTQPLSLGSNGAPAQPPSLGSNGAPAQPLSLGSNGAPAQPLSLGSNGERCVNCGAPLASDQRYCVNCGERRGKPRFEVAEPVAPTGQYVAAGTAAPPPARRPRTSAGLSLIAGVATLLLAMGVGVLIGHNSAGNSKGGGTPATQVITVGGGAGTSTGSTATTGSASTGSTGNSSHHGSHGKSSKTASKGPTKVVVQKAAAAASKVTGGSANVAPPTVTQGGACSNGQAGCQNGHLTGNYFGN